MAKRFFKYFDKYRKYLILSCICVIAETMFELIIPLIMADIIDVGVAMQDVNYILWKGIQMGLCALLSLILGLLYARYAAMAGQGFGAELRKEEFAKVQSFSFGNIDRFSTSSLVTRLTSDVTILQNAISSGIRPLVRAPFMLITATILSFTINAELAIVFLIAIPILGLALFLIVRKLRPLYHNMQRAIDALNRIVQENLIAVRVVKSYVRGSYEEEKFKDVNEALQTSSETAFRMSNRNAPAFQFVMYSTIIAILWFGGNLIFANKMQVGELTGFLSYILQILNSLMMISNVFMMLTRSIASAARIEEILDEAPMIDDQGAKDIQVTHGEIVFEHVSFKYKEEARECVLRDIDLVIPAGTTLGILGGTGSAKTSLVQLIPRLYDVHEGCVKVDGIDVREYPLSHLRDAIGMVLQKNTLFSGTVRENLCWGNAQADDKELLWACHIAHVDEFLDKLPHGLDTDLGQGGVNVSGGQKQRLCIARALLKHPQVLIFDDSTSAVDTASEAKIREALATQLPDTTKIIIAQRVSSIAHADQILILEDGRIHAIGTHEQLLATDPIYQELYTSQNKKGGDEDGKAKKL